MKEAFEELTLHGSPIRDKQTTPNTQNGTGFCLTPEALNELTIIHDKGLEKLKKIISNDQVAINQAPQILKEIPDSYWDLIK
jgi:hypothetical protein